jgi:hypothetical protein
MRRIRRIVAVLAACACGLACAVVIAAWVRTSTHGESLERVEPSWRVAITAERGRITICRWDGRFTDQRDVNVSFMGAPPAAWCKWAHWRYTGEIGTFAYPVRQCGDQWWDEIGFGWSDVQRVPVYNSLALHDWLSGRWAGRQRVLNMPFWGLAAAFALLPGWLLARALLRSSQRDYRSHHGLCMRCGYDVRVSIDRCPECGTGLSTTYSTDATTRPLVSR